MAGFFSPIVGFGHRGPVDGCPTLPWVSGWAGLTALDHEGDRPGPAARQAVSASPPGIVHAVPAGATAGSKGPWSFPGLVAGVATSGMTLAQPGLAPEVPACPTAHSRPALAAVAGRQGQKGGAATSAPPNRATPSVPRQQVSRGPSWAPDSCIFSAH